jgi:hypothetical protein
MANGETCYTCVYAVWDPGLWLRTLWSGFPARATCGNQPDYPGRMRECPPCGICRNFRPKPPTPAGPAVKTIPLGEGFYTYVDAADFEWLNQWTWRLHDGYAVRVEKRKYVYMHRQIMPPPEGMVVDHRNRNRLDNTRPNLRVCTPQENSRNRTKQTGATSRFYGVMRLKDSGRYRAYTYYKGHPISCGCFADELEAARAHDYKAVQVLGEEARLNLPEEWPPERRQQVHAEWLRTHPRPDSEGPQPKSNAPKHKNHKSQIVNRKSKALRAQARLKAKEPRPKSKGSKHKNHKSQITNHKSKVPRAKAPKGPARKKATGKRKRARGRE